VTETPQPAVDDLGDAVERFAAGDLGADVLTERFLVTRVYALRTERPGFVAVGTPGSGYIPIFSTLAEVWRYTAQFPERYSDGVDWLSSTGEDLLTLVPKGYGLVLDVASDHAVRLEATGIQRRPVLVVRRRENGGLGNS
jgi:type III secretion system (T3SS) SseB-like protein